MLIKPVENHTKLDSIIDLTIVVVCYSLKSDISTTIQSLLPPYQKDFNVENLELIIIDNGTNEITDLSKILGEIKYVYYKKTNKSLVPALNHCISMASSNLIGVMFDGGRIVTPGLLHNVVSVNQSNTRSIITTLDYYIGPQPNTDIALNGYDESVESELLKELNWLENGYNLFLNCSFDFKSLTSPISESNMIFMSKELWLELDGFDDLFKLSDGGFANVDLYRRSSKLKKTKFIRLANEATFKKTNSKTAKNNTIRSSIEESREEYQDIRKMSPSLCNKKALLYGNQIGEIEYLFAKDQTNNKFSNLHKIQSRLNCILNQKTDGLYYGCEKLNSKESLSTLIDSPIIIVGRGGSGTRVLSRLIQDLGLFMGNELNQSDDSVEWVKPLYSLIINKSYIINNSFKDHKLKMLRFNALSILKKKQCDDVLWGFKLPEAILCLPELIKSFPNAKFIHLTRHPVSLSMRRSHVTSRLDNKIGQQVLHAGYDQLGLDFNNAKEASGYINNAISWNYQLLGAIQFAKDHLNRNNYCEIKYEDICHDPNKSKNVICDFLGLELKNSSTKDEVIDASRVNKISYQENSKEINEVWEICGNLAEKIGYKKLYDVSNE